MSKGDEDELSYEWQQMMDDLHRATKDEIVQNEKSLMDCINYMLTFMLKEADGDYVVIVKIDERLITLSNIDSAVKIVDVLNDMKKNLAQGN